MSNINRWSIPHSTGSPTAVQEHALIISETYVGLDELISIGECVGGRGLAAICALLAQDFSGWAGLTTAPHLQNYDVDVALPQHAGSVT